MSSMHSLFSRLVLAPNGPLIVTGAFIAVIALIGLTFLISTIEGARVARNKKSGSKPPTLPYVIPFLGHLPEFISDTRKFLARVSAKYGVSTPVQIRLLNRRMVILKGAQNVTALFRNSKKLGSEKWLVQILVNAFGVEPADASFYMTDNTGIASQPDPRSTMSNPEHRIFFLVYRSFHSGLSGASLDALTSQLAHKLSTKIAAVDEIKYETWTEMPDIYGSFIRKVAFRASVESLYGSHIFDVVPTLAEDFWAFDSHLPALFKEMPRWLAPEAYKARDKMKENLSRWEAFATEHYDGPGGMEEPREWEEYFGSKLMRMRHEFFDKMPMGKGSVSADNLGLMWAASANIVPAIGWMLLEIIQRPKLLAEIREIISPHISWDSRNPPKMTVDIPNLCNQPLLQSIYAEVLRLHSGSVINRIPNCPDLQIGGWNLTQDQPVIVSTYNVGRDPTIWNQGTAEHPHSVEEFWAERFIIYPDDPHSGPVLKSTAQHERDDKKAVPRFSLDGTAGSWVPFGGGTRMCPGKHFAKADMIVTTAMFLMAFDIELLTDGEAGSCITPDLTYFMFGVMHPEGKIRARIRRRRQSTQ